MKGKDTLRITVDLPAELHRKLKALAAIHGKAMTTVVIESVEHQLKLIEYQLRLMDKDYR